MLFMSFEQFVSMPKHGYIYFFSMDGYCGLCKLAEIELEKSNVPRLVKVNAENEDDFISIGIKAVPCVRIYDTNEKLSRQWFGVLAEKQINEVLEYFKTV